MLFINDEMIYEMDHIWTADMKSSVAIYDPHRERLRLNKRWPCSTYILNRVN